MANDTTTLRARIGLYAVVLGPPAAGVAAWRHLVTGHPVLTVVLAAGYEAAVALAAFAAGVGGELSRRWRGRLVDRVDGDLRRRFTRFDRRYLDFVSGSLRFVDLKGLATIGYYTPELDEVFVDLRLEPQAPSAALGNLLPAVPEGTRRRGPLRDRLDRPEPVVLVLVGGPGSGKTTLLRHTARAISRSRSGRRRHVPVLLYLRDHVDTITAVAPASLPGVVRRGIGGLAADEPAGWFEQRLRDGDCVVLLDGLDEVARPQDRRAVADWIEHQVATYPRNDYVITSRPQGYLAAPVNGAAVSWVLPFDQEQASGFVRGWYLAVERHATGVDGAEARAEAATADLLARLADNPDLYELTVNPLLLTMISNVHRYRGALPGSRVELYGEICQVMLWRRHEAKRLPVEVDGHGKETVLRGLAFAMMRRAVRDLSGQDVLAEIEPALRRLPGAVDGAALLADVTSNGLLVERESGVYAFAHQTFQEYLAAAHIRDRGLVRVLVDAVDDPWWRETTLLYAARNDADVIVAACLRSGSVAALGLAFDCEAQPGELDPLLRSELEGLGASAFDPHADPERRALITRAMVARHLRQAVRVRERVRLCTRPVPVGLYRLFLSEASGPHEPEGSVPVESQDLDQPVVGVRAEDADGFVRWINGLTGDETCRLPTGHEFDGPAGRAALSDPDAPGGTLSAWVNPQTSSPRNRLWAPVEHDPHRVAWTTVVGQVRNDLERATGMFGRLLVLRSVVSLHVFGLTLELEPVLDLVGLARVGWATPPGQLDRTLALDDTLERAVKPYSPILGSIAGRQMRYAAARQHDPRRTAHSLRAITANPAVRLDLRFATDIDRRLGPFEMSIGPARDTMTRHLAGHLLGDAAAYCRPDPERPDRVTLDMRLVGDLTNRADGGDASDLVRPDSLAGALRTATSDLRETLDDRDPAAGTSWGRRAADRLLAVAEPVFARKEPVLPGTARDIRLASLLLGAEADSLGARGLGDRFRALAAGITLLERRAAGADAPTETIVLALGGAPVAGLGGSRRSP